MADDEPRPITLRRSTVVRICIAGGVLATLGIGIAIGFAVRSPSSLANSDAETTTTAHASTTTTTIPPTTTTVLAPTTTTAQLPGSVVASCPGGTSTPNRPTLIYVGCALNTTVTTITWSSWGVSGAWGTGTLHENSCQPDCADGTFTSVPASVVLTNPAGGFFQTVTVIPTSGGLSPVSADQPGMGWGSG